jgi:hypothetical protein
LDGFVQPSDVEVQSLSGLAAPLAARKEEAMKKISKTLVAAMMFPLFLALVGCSDGSSDGGADTGSARSLQGVWKEQNCNMGFAVDGATFTEYMNVTTGTITFAGAIVNNPDLTAEHGLIIVRIENAGMSGMYGAAVGKYTVAHWKTFTGDTVGQTNARDANRHPIFYATEAEAQALTEDSPELNRFCCQVSNRL